MGCGEAIKVVKGGGPDRNKDKKVGDKDTK